MHKVNARDLMSYLQFWGGKRMTSYVTLDYLPDLTLSEMASAETLTWSPYTATRTGIAWDNYAGVYGSDSNAILHHTYRITAREGATYDIFSTSFFDPYLLRVHDAAGNVIAANDEADDGSSVFLVDANYDQDVIFDLKAPYTGTYYVTASWHQGTYYKFYDLSIYEDLDTAPSMSLNGTGEQDILNGTMGNDVLNGLGGDDTLFGGDGNDALNGGDGTDTAKYIGTRQTYTVAKTTIGYTVVNKGTSETDSLVGIERVKFNDVALAFDVDGNAGQAYRLYQAAFNRKPDAAGLGTWIKYLDGGHSLLEVSTMFQQSTEFISKYGANISTSDFVTLLYQNVLHRAPDVTGAESWGNLLNTNQMSRADVLIGFSESTENKTALIGVVQSGMEFIPSI